MHSNIMAGVVAGLIAGVVFGLMMQVMTAPSMGGERMPMMGMVAKVVRSDSLVVGWLYHLFNSAVIGGLFGWFLASRVSGYRTGLVKGAMYGILWWVIGGLILMPIFLGMQPFAPLKMAPMLPVALGSLVGHMVYGSILGIGFVALTKRGEEIPAAVGARPSH